MENASGVTVPLAETIRALRAELYRSSEQGKDEALRFEVGEVEVVLQVEVSYDMGAEAGIKFGVVSVGTKGSTSEASTHTITLKLNPQGPSGEPIVVADPDVEERPE